METHKLIIEKVRASYAAIYLLSPEEQRSLQQIKKAAREMQRNVFIWTVQKGLIHDYDPSKQDVKAANKAAGKRAAPESEPQPMPDTSGAYDVLDKMRSLPEKSIVVLRLFHHFLDDPIVQSWMMDLIPKYKLSDRTILILTPVLKIPTELDKDLSLIELALPTKDELVPVLDGIVGNLPKELKPTPEKRHAVLEAAKGLTTIEAENAFSLSIVRPRVLVPDDVDNIWDSRIVMAEKCQALKKTGILDYIPSSAKGLQAVGGMDNLKDFVRKRKRAFSDEAKAFGLPPPKGILIIGPPGTGKSLGAKAISAELDLPLLKLDMGKVYGGLVGQSEGNIRMALATTEALAPCVLWIDEIEKGMAGGAGNLDSGVGQRVLGTLLTWMQEKTAPVFVYATANKPNLPAELIRKGRFDEMFSVDLPSPAERVEIFRIHLEKRGLLKKVMQTIEDETILTVQSDQYTGAEIEAVIIEAMYTAFDEKRQVTRHDIVEALQETQPQSKTMAEQIRAIREWCAANTRPANRPDYTDVTASSGRRLDA